MLLPAVFLLSPGKLTKPFKRDGSIGEQVAPILFLRSDEAGYIPGTALPVAGRHGQISGFSGQLTPKQSVDRHWKTIWALSTLKDNWINVSPALCRAQPLGCDLRTST
jgi:hypothetical protein